MGKNPSFPFYPSDWTRDLDDQDLEIEGAWIRIVCRLWWSETRGQATKSLKEWSRILRKTEQKTMKIFQILIEKDIASGDVLDKQNITIISRRMIKDFEISQIRQQVGKLGGNPKLTNHQLDLDNQKDNQKRLSSSSSSFSIKKESIKKEKIDFQNNHFINIPEDLTKKWEAIAPAISIALELTKAEAWVISNPKLKKSNWSRFLTNWIVRAQDHATKYGGVNHGINKAAGTGSHRQFNNDSRQLAPSVAEEADRIARNLLEKQTAICHAGALSK